MPKAPILESSKRLLGFIGRAQKKPDDDKAVESKTPELTVGGRRYRLIPVDPDEPIGPDGPVGEPVSAAELLTPRELQIVGLVADGRVNKQIADILRISEWTVSTHLRRVFAKLGVDTRAAMVSRCYGLTDVSRKRVL